ncbi:MAG: LirA/MavJ family T4SS effector [Acidimicrobiales bacterium]
MAWTAKQRAQILGASDPTYGPLMGRSLPDVDPTWPEQPAGFGDAISLDGPRLVSEFLEPGMGNPRIVAGLDALEATLRAKLAERERISGLTLLPAGMAFNYGTIWQNLPPGGSADPRSNLVEKLVTNALVEALTAAGFDLAPGLLKPLGFLHPLEFSGGLALRRHLKDALVGQDHGEWTHMLQWYLLATQGPRVGRVIQRPFPAAEVFRYLGAQALVQRRPGVPPGPDLWFVCCDRLAPYMPYPNRIATDSADFRNPDMLHMSIAGVATNRLALRNQLTGVGRDDFDRVVAAVNDHRRDRPLLAALFARRRRKREVLWAKAEVFSAAQAAARIPVVGPLLYTVHPPTANKLLPLAQQLRLTTFLRGTSDNGNTIWKPDWSALALHPGQTLDATDRARFLAVLTPLDLDRVFREESRSVMYAWSKSATPWTAAPGANPSAEWQALPAAERANLLATAQLQYLP